MTPYTSTGTKKPGPIAVLFGASVTQAAAAVGFWSFSLLAPELANETGMNERDFGLAISFIFLGTFFSSPFTGSLVARFGGMSSIALVLAAMSLALLLNFAAFWAATMFSAFLYGVAYGPHGAVSMTLVTQSAERRMRGLFLAIRHSSVPAAAALIGRLLPPLMLLAGWRMGGAAGSSGVRADLPATFPAGRRGQGAGRYTNHYQLGVYPRPLPCAPPSAVSVGRGAGLRGDPDLGHVFFLSLSSGSRRT
jgi:MFS family permease